MTVLRKPGRYLRMLAALGQYTLKRELAFRGNFLVKVSVEVLWLAIMIAFYRTVFARTSTIANWTEPQYFFFVGCFFALTIATSSRNSCGPVIWMDSCSSRSMSSS
jgi:ABC-type uncharacterized transport system permease subunit